MESNSLKPRGSLTVDRKALNTYYRSPDISGCEIKQLFSSAEVRHCGRRRIKTYEVF